MNIKKILISQPEPENGKSPYYEIAKKYSVDVVFRPLFNIETVSAREFRNQKINILEHTAIILNSRISMDNFFSLCKELRITIPETMKFFCISEQISQYLQKFVAYKKRKIFFPQNNSMAELADVISKHENEKFLMPVTEGNNTNEIIDLLGNTDIEITQGVMYRTVSIKFPESEHISDYDMVVLFSPLGLTALKENFPDMDKTDVKIAAFGPKTTQAVQDEGLHLEISAPSKDCPSMNLALDNYLNEISKQGSNARKK